MSDHDQTMMTLLVLIYCHTFFLSFVVMFYLGWKSVDFFRRRKWKHGKTSASVSLEEGYVVKGGRNQGPSQIKERPLAPAAMNPGRRSYES